MSLKHLKIEADVEQTNVDTLPSNDFTVPTGKYETIISAAYMDTAASGAEGLRFTLKPADGSQQEIRGAFWVTSGTAKGKNTYYINAKGKKQSLVGFVQASQLAHIACGKTLDNLVEEEKVLKLWNSANQAEENTKVRWLPELIGKPVKACVLRVRDNRKQKQGNEWINLPGERFYNEVDKVLHPSGHAVTEKNAGKEATFQDRWSARYPDGQTVDRYVEVANAQPAMPTEEEESLTEEGITSLFGSSES